MWFIKKNCTTFIYTSTRSCRFEARAITFNDVPHYLSTTYIKVGPFYVVSVPIDEQAWVGE